MKMMKKVFSILVLLILIGFITGCKTTTEPVTPLEPATTAVDTGLADISGELNDIEDVDSGDYDLDDIDIDEDMPPI